MSDASVPTDALTDAALLARSAGGDAAAYDAFVTRHQASIFRFARTQVSQADQAEDLLQQTFLSAWQGAHEFRGDGSARAWLMTITRHAASRLRQRHAREPLDATPVEDLGVEAGWGQASPELLAIRHERQVAVSAALAALPDEDREILTVRDLEGATGEQAAALLGLTVPAMKSRLHRARLRLAAQFRKGGHDVAR